MKLFIWSNPYRVMFGTIGYFAVAETVEEARAMAKAAPQYNYVEEGPNETPTEEMWRAAIDGPPTRIVDVPCGEWHEVSE